MKKTAAFFIIIFTIFLAIFLYLDFFIGKGVSFPLSVKKGESTSIILKKLQQEKIVKSILLDKITIRIMQLNNIKAGKYYFQNTDSLYDIFKKINSGKVYMETITIPEGFNIYDISKLLKKKGITNIDNFISLALNRDFTRSLNIKGDRVEGFLFPDTYKFAKGIKAETVIKEMVNNFWRHLPDKFITRAKKIGWPLYKIVILASIIEKETSVSQERRLISAVFHNRLKKKMKLQTDPTIIYGLLPNFNGNITRKNLTDRYNPWNTYTHYDLPPTPISNPGTEAIKAALYPERVNYLYFVSKNNGTHYFSSTFKEHNKAVYKYQIKRK